MSTSSAFTPAEGATLADYEGAAARLLPLLGLPELGHGDHAGVRQELEQLFEGARGMLVTPHGRVGFEYWTERQYDPEIVRSMLGPWTIDAMAYGEIKIDRLERLVKKLRKAGAIDALLAKEVLNSGKVANRRRFVAEAFNAQQRDNLEADRAALIPAVKRDRFKGYSI